MGLLVLVLALNGFSERQAMPGMLVYVVLCFLTAVGSAALSALLTKKLVQRRGMTDIGAGAISMAGFTAIGVVLIVIYLFLAVGIAELMRSLR